MTKELLQITAKPQRTPDGMVYVEYHIANPEIAHIAYHGETLAIVGSVQDTIDDFMPQARQALLNAVDGFFPDAYE